jgi:hypothetical protein
MPGISAKQRLLRFSPRFDERGSVDAPRRRLNLSSFETRTLSRIEKFN